jgi:hypothetical protein
MIALPIRVCSTCPGNSLVPGLLTELSQRSQAIHDGKVIGLSGNAEPIKRVVIGHNDIIA